MPLRAHIKIEKDQALKWSRRAYRYGAIFTYGYYYAIRLIILWLLIAMMDAIGGMPGLAPLHALALLLVWMGLTIYDYYRWYSGLKKKVVDWEFDAILDEKGVRTDIKSEREVPWSFYTGYREYDDHLEIHDEKNQVTFVPKINELAGLITFTKEKIRPL